MEYEAERRRHSEMVCSCMHAACMRISRIQKLVGRLRKHKYKPRPITIPFDVLYCSFQFHKPCEYYSIYFGACISRSQRLAFAIIVLFMQCIVTFVRWQSPYVFSAYFAHSCSLLWRWCCLFFLCLSSPNIEATISWVAIAAEWQWF